MKIALKTRKERLKKVGKVLVVGLMMQGCVLSSFGTAVAANPESSVLAGMEALVGELSWVSDAAESNPGDGYERYVALTDSPPVKYTNTDMNTDNEKDGLEAYVE